jgi:hypothetical protein
MPDEVTGEGAAGQGESAPQYVTAQQLEQMLGKLAGDTKAMIGRVVKTVEELSQSNVRAGDAAGEGAAPADDGVDADDKAPIKQKDRTENDRAEIKRKLDRLRARETAQEKREIRSALAASLVGKGVEADVADAAVDSLYLRGGDRWEVSEDTTTGKVEVRHKAADGPRTVDEVVQDFLTSAGRVFLPARGAPQQGDAMSCGPYTVSTCLGPRRVPVRKGQFTWHYSGEDWSIRQGVSQFWIASGSGYSARIGRALFNRLTAPQRKKPTSPLNQE